MRSEAEIRKQVETRLRRWALLLLNGILWVGAAKLIYAYSQSHDFFGSQSDVVVVAMLGWLVLLGLHALRVFYVELREYLVHRAVERQNALMRDDDEKPKRADRLTLSDDGELVDYPDEPETQRRGRDDA